MQDDYDEFGSLGDNAAEAGLALSSPPAVARRSFEVAPGQAVSVEGFAFAARPEGA